MLCEKKNFLIWQADENIRLLTTTAKDEEIGTDAEASNLTQYGSGIHSVTDISKFSRYSTLLRVTAYVKRFIRNCKDVQCT